MTDYNALFAAAAERSENLHAGLDAERDPIGLKKEVIDLFIALKAGGKITDYEVLTKPQIMRFIIKGNQKHPAKRLEDRVTISVSSKAGEASYVKIGGMWTAKQEGFAHVRDTILSLKDRGYSESPRKKFVESAEDIPSVLEDIAFVAMEAGKYLQDEPERQADAAPEEL